MTSTKASARFVIMPPSFSLGETHVARTLGRGKKGESPWAAIARVVNGELAFVPRAGLGKGELAALVAEAQAHLDGQTTKWSIELSRGFLVIRMNQMAKEIHDRAGEAAVCAYGFFVQNGKVVGVNGEGYVSLFPPDIDPWSAAW